MIDFTDVSKSFGGQEVLRQVSFRIGPGERIGIVGPNGAGKSTIFDLIVGESSPDRGNVTTPRNLRIGLLHQQLGRTTGESDTVLSYAESGIAELGEIERAIHQVETELAGPHLNDDALLARLGELQSRFETLGGYTQRHRAEGALTALGFSDAMQHDPFRTLSGGWQMRAELVRVLIAGPDVLLLDEPSNYLDVPAIEWLQKFLRDFEGTLVLISHDRFLLNSLTQVTLEVANARVTRYAGNYNTYVVDRVKRQEQALAAQRNQQRKRDQAERFIERFRAKNTKATAVQSRIKKLERMEAIEAPQTIHTRGRIRLPAPARAGQEIVRLEDAGITYDGQRWVLRHIDLRIERGDRLALVGLNGLGKTSLLRLLAGIRPPSEGRRVLGHKVTAGYQSQDFTDTLQPDRTVYDTVRSVAAQSSDQQVRGLLGGFGFSGSDVDKHVQVLSGGEKVRLAFARMLVNPPNFLLLDEPTTHLDVQAREALEDALADYEGTLCMVSHDIAFLRRLATRIVAMEPPGIRAYIGGYDDYAARQNAPVAATPAPARAAKPAAAVPARATPAAPPREPDDDGQVRGRQRRELKKCLERIERKIMEHERQQAELLAELNREGADYAGLNRRLLAVQHELGGLNHDWETMGERLAGLDSGEGD